MAEPGRARRTLYVGGVAEEVNIKTLTAAFLPFGEIVDVQIPMDIALSESSGSPRGKFEGCPFHCYRAATSP
jgi:RNA recognition motif-containing protein